jgi:CRISPR/Cas system endoribonuclease Cas6 (RAMP superfamily)
VWHVKEPSLLKAVSVKHRSKFAALSPVMVKVAS